MYLYAEQLEDIKFSLLHGYEFGRLRLLLFLPVGGSVSETRKQK